MIVKKNKMTKEDWLQTGLNVLAAKGEGSLTIDYLCKELRLTKGSFYHHFTGRDDYVGTLLAYWKDKHTEEIIKVVENSEDLLEQAHLLINYALKIPGNVEIAIRSWSLRDEKLREFQQQVDKMRLEFLQKIILPIKKDPQQTQIFCRLIYTCYIGCQQIIPQIKDEEYIAIINQLLALLNLPAYTTTVEEE